MKEEHEREHCYRLSDRGLITQLRSWNAEELRELLLHAPRDWDSHLAAIARERLRQQEAKDESEARTHEGKATARRDWAIYWATIAATLATGILIGKWL